MSSIEISLTKDQIALIDEEDFEKVKDYKWYTHKGGNIFYAYTKIWNKQKRKHILTIPMHRLIMNINIKFNGVEVDHINGNGLDNRKVNLRLCNRNQNAINSKPRNGRKYKGVWFNKDRNKWESYITCNYKKIHLGRHDCENNAIRAYNEAAQKYYGEYARLNNICHQ